MARQMRSGVYGISRDRTPAGLSASSTALASAGTEPVAPASPAPLAPSALAGDGTPQSISVIGAQVVGARHEIIHEAAGQELAGVGIVGDVLAEHLADALHQAAMQLALDQLVIVDVAAIVGGDVVDDRRRRRCPDRSRPRRYARRSETRWRDRSSCWCRADARARPIFFSISVCHADREVGAGDAVFARCRRRRRAASTSNSSAASLLPLLDDLLGRGAAARRRD